MENLTDVFTYFDPPILEIRKGLEDMGIPSREGVLEGYWRRELPVPPHELVLVPHPDGKVYGLIISLTEVQLAELTQEMTSYQPAEVKISDKPILTYFHKG